MFLRDEGARLPPAARTSALLARCVVRVGPRSPLSLKDARALAAGDREALLLHLRRETLGERIACVLACPEPACGKRMDVELRAGHLLLPPYADPREVHEATLHAPAGHLRVRFRLPTGADQEAGASLVGVDPAGAVGIVLARCVIDVRDAATGAPVRDAWSSDLAGQLSAILAQLDPQAEIRLVVACPECGHSFSAVLDAGSYLFTELSGRALDLYREVHALALHYHWSLAEILRMPRDQRRVFLDLLADALSEEARA